MPGIIRIMVMVVEEFPRRRAKAKRTREWTTASRTAVTASKHSGNPTI
jgi:hypothetical protein